MRPPKIWFLGAGSGAADLLTVRAARAIAQADVVVWGESMMDKELITEHARPDAELVSWPPATMAESSRSLILTTPSAKEPLREFAQHGATMAVFMAGARGEDLQRELQAGGYRRRRAVSSCTASRATAR